MINLAALYADIGQYNKAESFFQEAGHILEKILGKNHPDYATALADLGNLYYRMGRDTAAETLLLESKNIRKSVLGNEHPDYAASLNNLAQLYSNTGQDTKAELLFLEAKDIWFSKLGVGHLLYANSLKSLAQLYTRNGDYGKAEPLFLEAKGILAELLGKDHPDYADALSGLARLYRSTNRIPESASLILEGNNRIRRLIEKSAAYFSESQMLSYLFTFEDDLALFQSFAQIYPAPEFNRAGFDNALFYNGYLLENARHLARFVAQADSLTRDTFDRWQGCKRRLASEYAKPIAERRYVAELSAEAEVYEKTLTRKLPAFGEARQSPRWQNARDRLRAGEAAVEFIQYRYYNPEETDSVMYAAFVLLPEDTCPHFVLLCEQRLLDGLLREKYPDKRYQRTNGGNSLYSLLWQPIEPLLAGVHTVYYAPGGVLHSVNPDAVMLNVRGDSTLIDKYNLVRLGSTRQLVAPFTAKIAGKDALLFGGIRYESDSTAIHRGNGAATLGSSMDGLPEPSDRLRPISVFPYLPYTLKQVEFIGQLMGQKKFTARMFTGFSATEEAFKQFADSVSASGASARVLHLATHGYFFHEPKNGGHQSNRGYRGEPVYSIKEHPYLRSGLGRSTSS